MEVFFLLSSNMSPLKHPRYLIPLRIGRSREVSNEQVLADSEREAVSDLLQFLENVRGWDVAVVLAGLLLTWCEIASRDGLLLGRALASPPDPCLLR